MAGLAGRFTNEASRRQLRLWGSRMCSSHWGVDVLPSIGDLRTCPLSHTGKTGVFSHERHTPMP